MPIELYTGQPGNGKTALMMERLVEEAKKGDRPIFACGIDGLQDGLATLLDDPRRWNEKDGAGEYIVPNGAMIFVDEAWKWFGHLHDATRQQTPKHVLDLAEHRHRGLDFVWTTQQPNQLYPFVRGLIGTHSHVVRRFGTKMIDVFRWGELNEEIKSSAKRDLAQRNTRLLPSQIFGQYKSAEVHTIKPRIPWKVMALPVIAVAVVVLAYLAYQSLKPSSVAAAATGKGTQSASADAAPTSSGGSTAKPHELRWKSASEYAKDHLPRIATMPWTAPVFDERSATADPLLICMSSMDGLDGDGKRQSGSCTCLTEQGTAYDISQPECRTLARYGPVYNPYRERRQNRSETEPQQAHQAQQVAGQGGSPTLEGSVINRQIRALGSFPESEPYKTSTKAADTTREM
ncbi:zonular occludens toxin domain-containing protein [Stenotrophomonas sp. NPDC077464]|uniref:zonular occludens toxin domain-containing protein n=1 Tax=unclassified Stenotrophomonas TaxID=196198 RepID=UPI0037D7B1FA